MSEACYSTRIDFDPPLKINSEPFIRAWEIINDMNIRRSVAFYYVSHHEIKSLHFEDVNQAMLFKLRF